MLIDLSHPIETGMPVYPGDPGTELKRIKQFAMDGYSDYLLSTNMHAGTHIDGPMHLTERVSYMSDFPLDCFIGEGCLLDVSGEKVIGYKPAYEDALELNQIVILYTGHSDNYGKPHYFTEYPEMTMDFAKLLVRKKVKMIGLDTPSPDYEPYDIHRYLLQHNIFIIENLTNVDRLLGSKAFEIIALPLRMKADSSSARVAARL